MRVAGLATLAMCLATAALVTPAAAGFAFRAESSTDGGPWVEDGTIKYERLR